VYEWLNDPVPVTPVELLGSAGHAPPQPRCSAGCTAPGRRLSHDL
jgi:hypothetical protein